MLHSPEPAAILPARSGGAAGSRRAGDPVVLSRPQRRPVGCGVQLAVVIQRPRPGQGQGQGIDDQQVRIDATEPLGHLLAEIPGVVVEQDRTDVVDFITMFFIYSVDMLPVVEGQADVQSPGQRSAMATPDSLTVHVSTGKPAYGHWTVMAGLLLRERVGLVERGPDGLCYLSTIGIY
jgi:hypothetical protein